MNNQENIMENMVNAQKQVMDTIVENTKKFTNGNAPVTEAVQKGTEWYKNWLENQKNAFTQTTEQAGATTEKIKENSSKMNEFYQNWYTQQVNAAKQAWETSANFVKNAVSGANHDASNPMGQWNNMMNNMNNWKNNFSQGNNFMNNMNHMNNMNPFNQSNEMFNMDSWKKAGETGTNMFNQFHELLNSSFADWQKNFKAGTVQDAYHNMVNVNEGFTRFYEMMAPMWKSIQDKTFTMDTYKQYANPEMYKDLMDKYFGFLPENARQYMQNMGDMMQGNFKNSGTSAHNAYNQFRGMMGNVPGFNASDAFGGLMNAHNSFTGMMNNAFAPFAKMITPNQYTKAAADWNDISNRITVYNIKNAELQYMIYTQGTKVMDSLAENIAKKIESGEEVKSMMSVYQEWLNISDKVYVNLFESDEYSILMAEVSAMQLKLRKDVENQVEKLMVGIPVATRSEMDELYKTIYELKKTVHQLQKDVEVAKTTTATTTPVAETVAADTTADTASADGTANRRSKKA